MSMENLQQILGQTDIYLIDRILKGHYNNHEVRILDAGAGDGRNLVWFARNGFEIYSIDRNPEAVAELRQRFSHLPAGTFLQGELHKLPYQEEWFDHIICSAVLHFAEDDDHFSRMFSELARVLKPAGSVFIRTAVVTGMANLGIPDRQGTYSLPDGTVRYLTNPSQLELLCQKNGLAFVEPFKTVLVDGQRSMGVIVLEKSWR